MTNSRLLLADDHTLMLQGIRRILEQDFELSGTVSDGRSLVAAAQDLPPDVILLDISMPLLNGIDAAKQIRQLLPETKLIFLTMHKDRDYVMEIDRSWTVKGFEDKPRHGNPVRSVFNPAMISASMGIYVFNTRVLIEALLRDAAMEMSAHDFGHNILPSSIADHRVIAWDFRDPNDESARYWRDVATLDAYYEANMDLLSAHPECDLYDDNWPMRTHMVQQPPARFVFSADDRRAGVAIDSIVSAGCVIEGGRLTRSILSPGVRVRGYCEIDGSVLMSNCDIGRYSRIRRAIIPPDVIIPENSTIGFNQEDDIRNGYTVTAENVVVVPPPESDFREIGPEHPLRRKVGSGI